MKQKISWKSLPIPDYWKEVEIEKNKNIFINFIKKAGKLSGN